MGLIDAGLCIWTIGHSTHSAERFIELLQGVPIEALADIRRFPGSRRHPQFGRDALAASLAERGIDYQHFEGLGGRRGRGKGTSPNTAWRVDAFNAYADHTLTDEFAAALQRLIELATSRPTAVMCAEAVPWQCHRRVLADVLIAHGWEVRDIFPDGRIRPHALSDIAVVQGELVTYPGGRLFDDLPADPE